MSRVETFAEFSDRVYEILTKVASNKGYALRDKGEALFKFVEDEFGGHALGEVVYKAVRFNHKKEPEDLVKIAAWAYLVWANATVGVASAPLNGPTYDTHPSDAPPGIPDSPPVVADVLRGVWR